MDILKKYIGYTYKDTPNQIVMISVERVKTILEMNARNEKPDDLMDGDLPAEANKNDIYNAGNNLEDSLTRFDNPEKSKRNKKRKRRKKSARKATDKKKLKPDAHTSLDKLGRTYHGLHADRVLR